MSKGTACAGLGFFLLCGLLCPAQMSTFPTPPPLPPPSSASSDNSATNSFSPASPAMAPSSENENGGPAAPLALKDGAVPVSAATLNSMTALDDKVPLQPGDRISFRVIEDQDDAVPRIVTDTGEVDFPYIGRVKVQGMTCRQVALQLKRLLEVDYYKRATVIVGLDVISNVQEKVHDMVWVVGQVRQVGPLELTKQQPMTVSQVILRAGGFGEFADQRKVRLIRRGEAASVGAEPAVDSDGNKGEIVDIKAVFDGQSGADPVVQANDLIVVPKRLVNF